MCLYRVIKDDSYAPINHVCYAPSSVYYKMLNEKSICTEVNSDHSYAKTAEKTTKCCSITIDSNNPDIGQNDDFEFTLYERMVVFNDHSYAITDLLNVHCLNICGLKSKLLANEFLEKCAEKDLCLFQEIKTDLADEIEIRNALDPFDLDIIFKHRKNLAKHRSGGVAIIFNKYLHKHIKILESKTQDIL